MNSISLHDFAQFAADHNHGEFVIRTSDGMKTLDRHVVLHTSSLANLEARRALYAAIENSDCLGGVTNALREIRNQLGIDNDSPTRFTPLKLREVRTLLDTVRTKGMGKYHELQGLGFTPEEISLLRQTKTQTELTTLLHLLRNPGQRPPNFVPELKAQVRDALQAQQIRALIRNANEHGQWKPLAGFVLQKCLATTQDPARPPCRSLTPELVEACLKRALALHPTFGNLMLGPEMVQTLTKFITDCATETGTAARQLDATKERLRQMEEAWVEPLRAQRPEAAFAQIQQDLALFRDAETQRLERLARQAAFNPDTLKALDTESTTRFQRGLDALVSSPNLPPDLPPADRRAARVRNFAAAIFEMRAQELFDRHQLHPDDVQALRETFCRTISIAEKPRTPAREGAPEQDPFRLDSTDIASIEHQMEENLTKLDNLLKILTNSKTATDPVIFGCFRRLFEHEELQPVTDAEWSAVRTIYETRYAADLLPRCADPQLLDKDTRDVAIVAIVKGAVQVLKTARADATRIEQELDLEPLVLNFRADPNVTDDMRRALDDFGQQVLAWVRTELMRRPAEAVTAEARAALGRKIDELVAARKAYLRHHALHEQYEATRADFDRKIVTVESTLRTFVENLPPLRTRTTLDLRPGILSDAVPREMDAIWEKACDGERARYEREPRDFEPALPKFGEGPFVKTCEKDLAAAWETRGDALVKSIEDLEHFVRSSGLPESVGLTRTAQDAPIDATTAHLRTRLIDLVLKLREEAFAGNLARVNLLVDDFKQSVRTFIVASNRQIFNTPVRAEGQVDEVSVKALHTYGQIANELRENHKRGLSPDEGFNGALFEEGYRSLRRIFEADQEHFHTEAELAARMKRHYRQVIDFWTDLYVHVQERMRARVEPQFLGLMAQEAAEGSGHTTYALFFAQESSKILDHAVKRAQQQMMARGTPLSDAQRQDVNAELDAHVDEMIQEALAPANEQQRLIQQDRLKPVAEELTQTAEKIVGDMTTGHHLHPVAVSKEMLIAQAQQWINVQMTILQKPQPAPDDGVVHLARYPEPDLPALRQALKDHLKTFARLAPRVDGP